MVGDFILGVLELWDMTHFLQRHVILLSFNNYELLCVAIYRFVVVML